MFGTVVNQNMDIWQREIILWTSLVEISVINTNPDFSIFLGDRNDIRQPGGILRYFYQPGLYLLGDFLLNLQTQFRLEFPSLLLHRLEPWVDRQLMRYDIGTQPLHVTDLPNKHIAVFGKQMHQALLLSFIQVSADLNLFDTF